MITFQIAARKHKPAALDKALTFVLSIRSRPLTIRSPLPRRTGSPRKIDSRGLPIRSRPQERLVTAIPVIAATALVAWKVIDTQTRYCSAQRRARIVLLSGGL